MLNILLFKFACLLGNLPKETYIRQSHRMKILVPGYLKMFPIHFVTRTCSAGCKKSTQGNKSPGFCGQARAELFLQAHASRLQDVHEAGSPKLSRKLRDRQPDRQREGGMWLAGQHTGGRGAEGGGLRRAEWETGASVIKREGIQEATWSSRKGSQRGIEWGLHKHISGSSTGQVLCTRKRILFKKFQSIMSLRTISARRKSLSKS